MNFVMKKFKNFRGYYMLCRAFGNSKKLSFRKALKLIIGEKVIIGHF